MERVGVKPRRLVTQPEDDREPLAGWQPAPPYHRQTQVPVTVNEEPDISIRKAVHHELEVEEKSIVQDQFAAASPPSPSTSEDEMVVDMRPTTGVFQFNNVQLRKPGLTEEDLSINLRAVPESRCRVAEEFADLTVADDEEVLLEKEQGYVMNGTDEDVHRLLEEKPFKRGVICFDEILQCQNGFYEEGAQYMINGFQSKGAYGEAAMCRDLSTGKTFIRKKLPKNKLLKNEVKVPLMFRRTLGIPQVYGVIMREEQAELFQEFAGLSLKKILEEKDPGLQARVQRVREPIVVLGMALQAFATLDELHSQGIVHQDIKPENICLDFQKSIQLKFIDFGSSQTQEEQVTEGLTNEYLSPESCDAILKVASKQLPLEQGKLGPGTDVWATALSLLYCLLGCHVMIYVCTGKTHYEDSDPMVLQQKRIQCLFKVRELTDEQVKAKLIRPEWPNVLKFLLENTLRVDVNQRWTARKASDYIKFIFSQAKSAPAPKPVTKPQPSPEVAMSARPTIGFTGLSPSRLVLRQQATQPVQVEEEKVPVQCTSPSEPAPPTTSYSAANPPSPASFISTTSSQLPALDDLLSDDLSKKAPRTYRRKTRDTPYQLTSRRGSKNINN